MRLILQLIKGISLNCLSILMAPLLQHFLVPSSVTRVIFCLNLNEALLSEAWKLRTVSASVKVGSSLYYCHKRPDVFE